MEKVNYFPLRLKEERIRLGLSQDDAAVLCGVSREMWGKYERGSGEPASSKLVAFSEAGADVLYIFTGNHLTSSLDDDERILVNYYRNAPDAIKKAAMGVLLSVQTPDITSKDKPISAGGNVQIANKNNAIQIGGNNTGTVNNDSEGRKRK